MEKLRVLIVDDDVVDLQALPGTIALHLKNIHIDTSNSALGALQQVQGSQYDAIVSDIKMAGTDGITLAEKFRALCPDTPIILITGYGDHDLAIRALRAGAYDFIEKPINRDYFISSLQRAIQTHQMRRQIAEQQQTLEHYTHQLEQIVAERTIELVEANAAKDFFLSMVSHELKTPLTALKGTIQLIQRRVTRVATALEPLSSEMSAFFDALTRDLATSIRQIDAQTRLIRDLLDISRITTNTLELSLGYCDLVPVVRETVEDLQGFAPERAFRLALPEHTTVTVLADDKRLSQVIINYITNAIRYSSPSQPIDIGLTCQEEVARVWVRDQGPGISKEVQKDIWQRFHQVKEVPAQSSTGKGLGLGLAICQALITQHHGEVGVESAPGKGSTFWFTLPIVKE
ncbi:hybrid sensor histidine kinase/response regulator [Ktedonobacter sp. SOSP1-85]|uniref:sensor histidine kinase n=1 Tax=Ktedonobacter sp. SOSP1-85 TaxID=2778367 RepID=UPI0019152090|nr:hybrid sensor histidine kinase/response regulator [Ktedonobacter sp. SOSP1-85]GHO72265.1 hybrid sensor histidine kinase/response regulator [Ktedonobacter sp. SOSP1-85]